MKCNTPPTFTIIIGVTFPAAGKPSLHTLSPSPSVYSIGDRFHLCFGRLEATEHFQSLSVLGSCTNLFEVNLPIRVDGKSIIF